MTDSDFIDLVRESVSVGDICKKLGTRKGGGIFTNIQRRIENMNLNTNHFIDGRIGEHSPTHISKEEFMGRLADNCEMDSGWMKKKIIEFSLIPNKCHKCQLVNIWNGEPLTLHMDHIDGDYMNNSLNNLRFLCPNCHSQTPTFSMGKRIRKDYRCDGCGKKTSGYSNKCRKCKGKLRQKVNRPSKEELEKLVKTMPISKIALQFGMSHTAIRKWCKSMDIDYKVGTGYWTTPEDAIRMHSKDGRETR